MLIAGVGNAWRGDDGASAVVLQRLRSCVLPPGTATRLLAGGPLDLLDALPGHDVALIVDTIRSGASPGSTLRIDVSADSVGPRPAGPASTHALDLAGTLELGRILGLIPARVIVYGVEGEQFDVGHGLSAPVRRAIPGLTRDVLAEAHACSRRGYTLRPPSA